MLRNLEDFRVTLNSVAMAWQWKAKQKKSYEDQGIAACQGAKCLQGGSEVGSIPKGRQSSLRKA